MRSLAAHRTQKAWTATLPCWYPFKARSWFLNGHKYPMLVSDTRKGYEDTKEKVITVFYAKKGCALVFARIPSLVLRSKTLENKLRILLAKPFVGF